MKEETSNPNPIYRAGIVWGLVGLSLVAFVLRLAFLGRESLWFDEAFASEFANLSVSDIWFNLWRSERHPPLYYLIIHYMVYFGQSEAVLRLPSVLFSTIAIPLLFSLGRRLFSEPVAWGAALLLALSPLTIWYSQEARMYALAGLCTLWAIYCFVQIGRGRNNLNWLGYILAAALSLYSLYTTGLLLLILNALALVLWIISPPNLPRFPFLSWLLAQVAVLFLYFPWLTKLPYHWQIAQKQTTYPLWVLTTPLALVLFIIVSVVAFAGFVWWVRRLARNPFSDRPALLVWALVLLLFIYFGFSLAIVIHRGLTLIRQFYIFIPLLYLAIAALLATLPRWRRWLTGLLAISLALSIFNTIVLQKPRWRDAALWTTANAEPGDVIVLSPPWLRKPFLYYFSREDIPVVGISAGQIEARVTPLKKEYQRAWLVLSQKEERWADPQQQVRSWFHTHYLLEREDQFGLLDVARFKWGGVVSQEDVAQ